MNKVTVVVATLLLTAGAAHAAGEFDVSEVQTQVTGAVTTLLGFVAAVGLSKAGLNAAVWGWNKIKSLAGSK